MKHHLNLILNQFPPHQRKSLVHWLRHSKLGRKAYHKSFLSCMEAVPCARPLDGLDRRSKVAFSVIQEFGDYLKSRSSAMTLINTVELHLLEQSISARLNASSSSGLTCPADRS